MAKQKLNVKFLAIFLGIAAVLLVAATVIGLVIYRNDPIKHITTGDGYMANQQFDRAAKSYFRAFGKDPYQTAEYRPIDKSIEAVQSIVPKTDIEARDRQNQILTLFANKAIYAPDPAERDATITEQVIPVMRGIGIRPQLLSTLINRDDLSDETRARLEGLAVEPDWMGASRLSSNEWESTRGELEEIIELDPTNVRNQFGLLRGELEQAFKQGTNSLKISAATEPFDEALAAARESAGSADEVAAGPPLEPQEEDAFGLEPSGLVDPATICIAAAWNFERSRSPANSMRRHSVCGALTPSQRSSATVAKRQRNQLQSLRSTGSVSTAPLI